MLTSATFQGGQDAAPGCGCKTPPSRLVLPPWFLTWPLTQRASWSGVRLEPSAAGYELVRPRTALSRGEPPWIGCRPSPSKSSALSQPTGRPSKRRRPRAGSASRQRTRDERQPASTSWRTSCSEREAPSRTEAASPRPSGPSLTGPHTRNFRIQELDASDRRADRPTRPAAALHSKGDANFALDNQPPIRARCMRGL